jgi:hypothetical protein
MLTVAPGLKKAIFAADIDQLGKYLKKLKASEYPCLVMVVPFADSLGEEDNFGDKNTGVAYVLESSKGSSETMDSFFSDLEECQQLMEAFKDEIRANYATCSNDFHDVFKDLEYAGMHMEPEYNLFGCNGWSLSYRFDT